MKYTVTHACGHTSEVNLCGKESQRQYRLGRLKEEDCPDCLQAASLDRMEAEIASGAIGRLDGSVGQVEWAGRIRRKRLEELEKNLEDGYAAIEANLAAGAISVEKADEYRRAGERNASVLSQAMRFDLTRASWWIDRRGLSINQFIQEVQAFVAAHGVSKPSEVEDISQSGSGAAAKAAATIQPQNQTENIIAEIAAQTESVTVSAPKCEALRVLLRSRDYTWDKDARLWRKAVSFSTGPAENIAAEVGNACLLAGIPVRIYDDDIRRRASDADFEPEHKRWVSLRTTGAYKDWLAIKWEKGEQQVYDAARRIPGSRWDSPNVVVPVEQYRAVEDFADIMDFKISPGAADAIQAYKDHEYQPIVPAARAYAPDKVNKLAEILRSSRDTLEDLRDDDA